MSTLPAAFIVALLFAQPALIGGSLSATAEQVTLTSTASIPVRAVLRAGGSFTLTPSTFPRLNPGQTVTATVTGEPAGTVTAELTALGPTGQDRSSVTLTVRFGRPAPEAPPVRLALSLIVLVATLAALALLWLRYRRRSIHDDG